MAKRDGGVQMDVRVRETLHLDVDGAAGAPQRIEITVEEKSGQVARLRILAADTVRIIRPRRREPESAG
jgi:hypothetical protein